MLKSASEITVSNIIVGDKNFNETQLAINNIAHKVYVEPVMGDLNVDGRVSIGDLSALASWYSIIREDPLWWEIYEPADFNHDGKLNIIDLATLAKVILE